MNDYVKFEGNCPKNISKDASYSIKKINNIYMVCLLLRSDNEEEWFMSTDLHPDLVERINKVKTAINGSNGGRFYINEYRQVLIPHIKSDEYYLAGEYYNNIYFKFEGKEISGNSINFEGNPLNPGDIWAGPHPGIPYILQAGGRDIKYKVTLRKDVKKVVRLSRSIGSEKAARVSEQIAQYKGLEGGRFYVNEYCSIFTPTLGEYGIDYIYIGQIDLSAWFPKPNPEYRYIIGNISQPET